MTERKPPGMSFTSWIDEQISAAQARGAFDDLPGAGKPLPDRGSENAAEAWLRDYAVREGVPAEDLLPVPLRLRKETELLTESVHLLRSEQEVRDTAAELNQRIRQWRAMPLGPPLFVPLADEEKLIARWREQQPAAAPAAGPAAPADAKPQPRRRRRLFSHRRR
ncbi:MAG: DUF1992 domain-containing protein [Streptosporangiaceae bacterium]